MIKVRYDDPCALCSCDGGCPSYCCALEVVRKQRKRRCIRVRRQADDYAFATHRERSMVAKTVKLSRGRSRRTRRPRAWSCCAIL